MFRYVLAVRPIAEIFGQLFFAAICTWNSRLDRHLRHLSILRAGMVKIFADDCRVCKYLRVYL